MVLTAASSKVIPAAGAVIWLVLAITGSAAGRMVSADNIIRTVQLPSLAARAVTAAVLTPAARCRAVRVKAAVLCLTEVAAAAGNCRKVVAGNAFLGSQVR